MVLLADPYDAVRFVAFESLRRQPGFEDFPPDAFDYVASREQRTQSIGRLRDRLRAVVPRRQPADYIRLATGDDRDPRSVIETLAARRDDRVVNLEE